MMEFLVNLVISFFFASILVFIGWMGWILVRLARVTSRGAVLTECRNPDCDQPGHEGGLPPYLLRHVTDTADLKLHGPLMRVVKVWEVAYDNGIVHDTRGLSDHG